MITKVMASLLRMLPATTVYAHCDVPCGIYDPKPAQIAAATVLKMVQKLAALTPPNPSSTPQDIRNYQNDTTRMIWTKEEHARKCKEELYILWSDYFKPEHLEKFPDLHTKFWTAVKLCSENKQHVSEESAQKLIAAVDEIAQMFVESKK